MFLYLDYSRYIYSFSKPWGCYVCMCVCKFYECFLSLEAVCVCLYACRCKIFNPPPQFSRLGIQVSLAIICLFVWAMVGWVTLPFFSFLFL